MSKSIPGNNKHLTLVDRMYIEQSLDEGLSFREIARYLCKDPSTISAEVMKNRIPNTWNRGSFTNPYNFCVHRFRCRKTNVCEKLVICDNYCRSCHKCNSVCSRFEREECRRITKAPYVCNGCPRKRNLCQISTKYDYNAKAAHRKYTERLVGSRQGISLTRKQLHELDFWEMDTVMSAKDSNKCILTFYFPETELLYACLLCRCSKGAVKDVFDLLEERLGDALDFQIVFQAVLTDRGGEFGDPVSLETSLDGHVRTAIYYCDPMRSGQKGGIESVHAMLRMIIPKGTVFTDLTQWDVRRCVDHINSTPRKSVDGSTPYLESCRRFDEDVIKALQLRYVAPDEVTLTPKLLKL